MKLQTYPRPLPKGTIVEFCGERAKLIKDEGQQITVAQGTQRMVWHWKFGDDTVDVIRLPKFTLTEKRRAALEVIKANPGCYVSHVAQSVLVGAYRTENGRGFHAQQATRSGAGYCIALERAGLVKIRRDVQYGFGTVTLTPAGKATIENPDNENTSP